MKKIICFALVIIFTINICGCSIVGKQFRYSTNLGCALSDDNSNEEDKKPEGSESDEQ